MSVFHAAYGAYVEDTLIRTYAPKKEIPERRLLAAILLRAFLDLDLSDRLNRRSAQKWFFSNGRGEFSLIWLLTELSIYDKIDSLRHLARIIIHEQRERERGKNQFTCKGKQAGAGVVDFFERARAACQTHGAILRQARTSGRRSVCGAS